VCDIPDISSVIMVVAYEKATTMVTA